MLLLAVTILLPSTGPVAHAQATGDTATFRADMDGLARTVSVPVRSFDGRPFVDLQRLAEGLDAGFVLTASRVQMDLAGASAWIYFNDNRVQASGAEFTLTNPVVQRDERAWMAMHEAPAFIQQAFGITMSPQTGQAETSPEPLLDLDVDLLTPSEPDEPPALDEPEPEPLQEITPDAIRDLRAGRGPERIVIDPAHGGEDTGVAGPRGVLEKDVVLAVATALRERLLGRIGGEVVLTREDDRPVETRQRAAKVTNPAQTLFISLQCGGTMSPQASGAAAFYLPDIADATIRQLSVTDRQQALAARSANATASRRLAERILRDMEQQAGITTRGVRGVASRVLLAADSPGVIIELGCLTSPDDEERLGDSGYQEELASVIAEAILSHYGMTSTGATR